MVNGAAGVRGNRVPEAVERALRHAVDDVTVPPLCTEGWSVMETPQKQDPACLVNSK